MCNVLEQECFNMRVYLLRKVGEERYPNLTALDSLVSLGHVKKHVFQESCDSEEEMRARTATAFEIIKSNRVRYNRASLKRCGDANSNRTSRYYGV